jgi:ATP-binding cassette, subfamily C (CFTR/MRP), member 1
MNSEGTIAEQGSFEQLKQRGGYTSSFAFASTISKMNTDASDGDQGKDGSWDHLLEKKTVPESTESEVDDSRRTGDFSVYLYYIQAIGWIPTIIFVVCISCYVFGISFPCKLRYTWFI